MICYQTYKILMTNLIRLKMKKIFLSCLFFTAFCSSANAGEWNLQAHGLAGAYYGVSQTNNVNKYPNRWVLRADSTIKADYIFNQNHKSGIHASTTIMFRQDDKNRRWGEYRFYPYFLDESQYGSFYLGYAYNVAHILHKGAKEITFLKIDDSNATYFLNNPNWNNGFKSTLYATPKSTSILNDGRAPKFNYITPDLNGFKAGFSYTPDNANRRGMTSRYVDYEKQEDGYTVALQKKHKFSEWTLYTSAGYGLFNRTDNEFSFGATVEYKNFNIASGYKKAYIDGKKNPISDYKVNSHLPAFFDNYRESEAWNISAGYKWEKYQTNFAYLNTSAKNTRHQDNLLIWSNIYNYNKYFDIYLVGAYLNYHQAETFDDNRGYAVITGIGLKF